MNFSAQKSFNTNEEKCNSFADNNIVWDILILFRFGKSTTLVLSETIKSYQFKSETTMVSKLSC